jgi:hypothetical protein
MQEICDNDTYFEQCINKFCLKNHMVYKPYAVTKYGLYLKQLDQLNIDNNKGKNNYMYNEKELYDLQKKIIETLPKNNRQLKKLLIAKNIIEIEKKQKEELCEVKKHVIIQLNDMLSKLEKKYIDNLDRNKQNLINKYVSLDFTANEIAFKIYDILEIEVKRAKENTIFRRINNFFKSLFSYFCGN